MKTSGIYKIQSIIKPERFYIGSAIDIKNRWGTHKNHLKNNKHHSTMLQRHYNKYGLNDLVFSIVEPCLPQFLTIRENAYIKPRKPYFNVCENAGNTLGFKYSKEQIEKIKESRKNYKPTTETKVKIRKSLIGNKNSLGVHPSEETRKKLSEKLSGVNNPRYGKKLSDETKQKIREKAIGRRLSPETKLKLSKAGIGEKNHFYGKCHSDEAREKISKKAIGRKRSDEDRRKMSESRKGKLTGKNNPMYGVHNCGEKAPMFGKKHSEKAKIKMSLSHKNCSEETRRKRSESGKLRKHTEEEREK